MTQLTIPQNAYTDAPELHPNLLVASVQLLGWFIFHPSAWRNYVARIDPDLPPDFCLAELKNVHWHEAKLRRLLLMGYVIWPFLSSLIVTLTVWVFAEQISISGLTLGLVFSLSFALTLGLADGLALGLAFGLVFDLVFGLEGGLAKGLKFGLAFSVRNGLVSGISAATLFSLFYTLAKRFAGSWAGTIAGTLGMTGIFLFGLTQGTFDWIQILLSLMVAVLGLTQSFWHPVLSYPLIAVWNFLLYRIDQSRNDNHSSLLHWHSAFWDEYQRLPLFGLDDHLVLAAERNPLEGQAAISYLTTSRQRWAVQAAQIELDARQLERCADAKAIGGAHRSLAPGQLEGPASFLFRSFSRISQDVEATLQQESKYNQRIRLKVIEESVNSLSRDLTRSSEQYAVRFQPIAIRWRDLIANHGAMLTTAVEARQEIDHPYIIGVPLSVDQQIFVGRIDITARIEQLLLDRLRPPLLLYGQRRMGKTSLLNNLGRLLSSTMIPLFVDLQGAVAATDHAGLLANVARDMSKSASERRDLTLPPLSRESLVHDPFSRFSEWLDEVEQTLGQNIGLLALDEFEALDGALTKGKFDETSIFGILRNLIQHRPRFKVLLAGSHTFEELQRWASYLINVQVVRLSYLKEAEARQLIEQPVKDFALRYEPEACQRVLAITHGHPFLLQLLCSEIVTLKNEQAPEVRRLAHVADIEAAIPEALSSGSFFFADIESNQVDAAGLSVLRFVAAHGEKVVVSREVLTRQFSDNLDQALALPMKRELLEQVDGGYRFQVELIRRWFVRQGA